MAFKQINLKFEPLSPWSDILVAFLSEQDYDSFEETDNGLKAFIDSDHFSEVKLQKVLSDVDVSIHYELEDLKQENWNAKWESNFKPVVIDKRCGIRASFHSPLDVEHEVVITPKMSFGTGHHSTTFGMMKTMMDLDFTDKTVLDMGCGTAVLAILASKLKANKITAIDIDEWAYTNSLENIQINQVKNISVLEGGSEHITDKFDIILANINRNVLLNDMHIYSDAMKMKGDILLSGFYTEDLPLITKMANQCGLSFISNSHHNNWVTAHFKKIP
jgi:ribosomal protein L11 methyltransferase